MHPVPAMKTDKVGTTYSGINNRTKDITNQPEDNENIDSSIWDSAGNILTISNLKWTLAEAWGLREIIVTGDAHSEFETRLAPGAYSAVPFRARLLRCGSGRSSSISNSNSSSSSSSNSSNSIMSNSTCNSSGRSNSSISISSSRQRRRKTRCSRLVQSSRLDETVKGLFEKKRKNRWKEKER
ncbi:hypothetical protein HZH68_004317 [Vespula germanica]|uniref:Uncharacterized protein n=1 Tax=Vespula germanica TaxID=30212 RepID=A0A834KTM5_VESGE|nr:hypothetical protein HZH68_004317 [Vespula germanica]